MSYLSMLSELAEVGITPAAIEKAVGENPQVRAEVIKTAQEAAAIWGELWEEMGPHPYETGAYKQSITIEYETKPSGEFSAVVRSKRDEAVWLEYGTSKMHEFAPAQKTVEILNGEKSGATSKKASGGRVGQIGG